MDQPPSIREALRIFRMVHVVKLVFLGLTFLVLLGLQGALH